MEGVASPLPMPFTSQVTTSCTLRLNLGSALVTPQPVKHNTAMHAVHMRDAYPAMLCAFFVEP